MADQKRRILHAVANPKQFLWAPFEMAIINMIIAVAFMLLCIALLGVTPFFCVIPLIVGHVILVGLGAQNQHLTTTIRAMGKYPGSRKNLAAVKVGVKFTP